MHFFKSTAAVALFSLAGFSAASPLLERGYCNPIAGGDSQCATGEHCVQQGEFPNIGACTTDSAKRQSACNPAAASCPEGESCVQQGEFPNIGVCKASASKRAACDPISGGSASCADGQTCVQYGEFPNIGYCA